MNEAANILIAIMALVSIYYLGKIYLITRAPAVFFLVAALVAFAVIRIGNAFHWDWMLGHGRELGVVGYGFYLIGFIWLYIVLRDYYGPGGSL